MSSLPLANSALRVSWGLHGNSMDKDFTVSQTPPSRRVLAGRHSAKPKSSVPHPPALEHNQAAEFR